VRGVTPSAKPVSGATKAQPSAQPLDIPRLMTVADSAAQAHILTGLTPGMSVGVAQNGQLVLARFYGKANVEAGADVNSRTMYKVGSITKQFTAAIVMRLMEEGKLSLSDPITKYLPDYPTQGHHVTIRHLLNHTSGIKAFRVMHEENRQRFRLDLTYPEMVEMFAKQPFEFEPGEKYEYNNFGYYLLGEIIGRVTNIPYQDYLEREFLQPLGLVNIMYCEASRVIPQRAAGYEHDGKEVVNARYLSMRVGPAAGGLCATTGDLLLWTHLLHSGRVVSPASLQQMTAPTVLANGDTIGYGYGLQLGELGPHQQIYHGGGANGFVSSLAHYPKEGLTVVVMANSVSAKPIEVVKALARTALHIKVQDLPLTPEHIARYSGIYTYKSGAKTRELKVYEQNGKLHAQVVGGRPFRLRSQGSHVFIPSGNDDNQLIFKPAADRAAGLIIREGRWEVTEAKRQE
jgi:CubicO group peptidase (beta-lactamase class C family)